MKCILVGQQQPTGVTSFKSRTGAVVPQTGDYTADMVGAVPTTRKVNNKQLNADITLDAEDVGARPDTWTPTAAQVGAVPTSRKVNNKALSSDITLNASDVGAVPTSRTVNGKALSSNITLTASDVGAATTAYVDNAIGNAIAASY